MSSKHLPCFKSLKTSILLATFIALCTFQGQAQCTVNTFPYVESFDTVALPSCWTASAGAGYSYLWSTSTNDGTFGVSGPYAGSGFAFLDVYDADIPYNPYTLTSPSFVLPATAQQLSYYYYLGADGYQGTDPVGGTDPYPLSVMVSTDGGVTWTDIYDHSASNTTFATTNATSNWHQNTISLAAYAGQTILIQFVSNSNYGCCTLDQGLDVVSISTLPTCFPPTGVNATAITTNSATLNWTAPTQGTPAGYQWEVVASGAGPYATPVATNFFVGTQTTAATGATLAAGTTYDAYVKTGCSLTDTSTWSLAGTFSTLCAPISSLPWTEGFEGLSTVGRSIFPNCWSTVNLAGTDLPGSDNNTLVSTTYGGPHGGSNFLFSQWNNTAWVFTPGFQLTGGTSYDFSFFMEDKVPTNPGFTMDVSYGTAATDAGMTNSLIAANPCTNTSYQQFTSTFTPATSGVYYIGIKSTSTTSSPWYLSFDDFALQQTPSCVVPTALVANSVTGSGASVSWTASTSLPANGYNWEAVASGAGSGGTQVSSGSVGAGVTTASVTGFSPNTTYDIYVQSNCASGTSAWAGPLTVTTPCANVTLPLVQGFNSTSIPSCWSQQYVVGTIPMQYVATSNNPVTTPEEGTDYVMWSSYTSPNTAGNETRIVSPPITTTGINSVYTSFWWFNDNTAYNTGNYLNEGVTLQYSLNGTTWTDVQFYPRVDVSVTTTSGWFKKEIILPAAVNNQSTVYVGFKFHSEYGNNCSLDNLNILATPACLDTPTALTPGTIGLNGFTAGWTAPTSVPAGGYNWIAVASGAGPTGTPVASGSTLSTVDSAVVTGLSASTTYDFYVQANCGSLSVGTWVGPLSVTTLCGNTNIPLIQGFNNTVIPACWTQQYVVGTDDLVYVPSSTFNQPIVSAPEEGTDFVNCDSYNFNAGDETRLVSPSLITTGTPSVDVNFWWFYDATEYTTGNYLNEGVEVQYSLNGTTWTDVQFVPRVDFSVTNGSGWYKKTVTLPAAAGNQASVYVGFKFHSEFGDDMNFDNLTIASTPACTPPSALVSSNVTAAGATVSWTPSSAVTAVNYTYIVVPSGAGLSGTVVDSGTTTADSANVTNLQGSTSYDFYVSLNCTVGNSTWVGPLNITTPCVAITSIPWTEGFEGLGTNVGQLIFPPCWTSVYQAGSTFEDPGTDNGGTVGTFGGPHNGTNFMYTKWDNTSWVYTPGFQLTGGTSYDFSFFMENKTVTSPVDFVMNVAVGSSATPAGMTDTLINGYVPSNTSYQKFLRSFIPPTTGVYYFGVNSSSATSLPWYLSFDDFSLQLTPPCAGYPDSLLVSSLSSTGGTASWTAATPAPANGYHWEVVPANAGPGATPVDSGTTAAGVLSATMSGLTANTSYDLYVESNCGGILGVGSWTGPLTFLTPCINATLPLVEGFNGTTRPACWSQQYVTGNTDLQYVANSFFPTTAPEEGTDFVLWNSSNTNTDTRLISPPITSTGTPSVDMQFYWFNENSTFANNGNYLLEGTTVQYSLDGVNWTDVQFFPRQDNSVPSGTGVWKKKTITFPLAVANQPTFYVGFQFHGEFGDNSALDNINIFPSLPCAGGPTAVNVTNVTINTATLNWTAAPSAPANGYNWVVVAAGDSVNGTAIASGSTAAGVTTASVSGLSANTPYDVYVQSNCGGGNGTGYWVGPLSFSTPCTAITTLPWTEGFEGLTTVGTDILPPCWLGAPRNTWTSDNTVLFNPIGPRGGSNYVYIQSFDNDDTIYTPSFNLTGGTQYEFYFYYVTDGNGSVDSIYAMYGSSQTATGMTTIIGTPVTNATNTSYVKYSAIFTPATSGTYYFGTRMLGNFNFGDDAFDDFGLQVVVPCPNPPLGGTISGPTSVCPGSAINMSLTGYSPYTNLQWQTSIDSVNFIDIPSANSDVYTDFINNLTYYRVKVNCADSSYSAVFAVHINPPTQCYCNTNLGGFCGGNNIDTAEILGTNFFVNYTTCNTTSNGDAYTLFPTAGDSTVTLQRGSSYTLFLHMTGISISSAWIDYNQNGTFDANSTEWVQITTAANSGTATLNVPANAALGVTGFRIRSRNQGNQNDSTSACQSFGSGETFDFHITIIDTNCNRIPTVVDTISNVTCFGSTNGAIALSLSGGLPPFTHHWSTGSDSSVIYGVGAGAYTDTISFYNGCTYIWGPDSITQPALLTGHTDSVNAVKCFGGNTGNVYITVAGGTATYAHHWSNGSTADPLVGVPAGIYTDTIKDSHGCTVIVGPDTVKQPASALSVVADSVHEVKCNGGNTGAIYITASGGAGGFSYLWSNTAHSTTDDLTGVAAGTYSVVVTDANLCTATLTDSVTQPGALSIITDSIINTKCHTSSDGSIYVHLSGGTIPYTYTWTGGSSALDLFFKPAGTYTLSVTDHNGCTTSATDTIKAPGAISIASTITNQIQGGSLGSVSLNVTGGTSPYKYHWNTGDSTSSLSNLPATVYKVTVTDANGCTAAQTDTVKLITSIIEVNGDIKDFNIYPNPSSGQFNVVLELSHVVPVQIEVYSITGQAVPVSPIDNPSNNTYTIDMTSQAEGVYFVKVTAGGNTLVRRITVVR